MRKFIIIISVLLLCIAGVAVLYFSQITTEKRSATKILSLIPADAAFVFELNNEQSFYDIFRDYELFDAILGKKVSADISQLKATLLDQPQLKEAMEGQNIFLSLHAAANTDSVTLLWLISLNTKVDNEDISNLLAHPPSNLSIVKQEVYDRSMYEVLIKTINKKFYIYLESSLAIGSFSKEIISQCLNEKNRKISEAYIAEINNNQKNKSSPVNLFINHESLPIFFRNFTRSKNSFSFLTSQFKGFSSLNMNFKSDALMFNGIISTDTLSKSYLNIFLKQKPVASTLINFFPDNTAVYTSFGLSNNAAYYNELHRLFNFRGELSKLQNQLKYITTNSGADLERDLKPLFGNEFALFQLSNQEKLAVIKIPDENKLNFILDQVSSLYAENLRRLNYSHILYYYFGDPLKEFTRPYYTVIDNYLLLSNSPGSIQNVLKNYNEERFLLKTPDYQQFNQLVGNQSNILFFTQYKNGKNMFRNLLKRNYFNALESENFGFENFYGFSYQLSSEGDHFFANVYTNYKSTADKISAESWKFKMNARIAMSPQVITDSAGTKIILVQDNVNNLYAISNEGKKIWSIQLAGKILGEIKQLKDLSLVFNTSNRVYRLSAQGESFSKFPVGLSRNATYGLTLSASGDGEEKILIAANNQIIGIDTEGNLLDEWNKTLNGKILCDLKTTQVDQIKYVIAATTSGQFYFYNSNGNLISSNFKIDEEFKNPLFLNPGSAINTTSLLTTDTTGTVRQLFLDGHQSQNSIDNWSSDHFFDYKNIVGDSKPEFIYLDKNQLNVYNSDNSLLYNFQFNSTISQHPVFFTQNGTIYQLGVASEKENLIYLFNNDGSLVKQFPLNGLPAFYVGQLNNDGFRYLLCGKKDNYLYAYKL